jgi:hypothetical protein
MPDRRCHRLVVVLIDIYYHERFTYFDNLRDQQILFLNGQFPR